MTGSMLGFGRLGARLFGTRSDRAEAKRETRRVKGAEPGLVAPGVGDAFVPSAGVEPASERALRAGVEPASERALRAGVDAGLELGARAADGAAIDPPGPVPARAALLGAVGGFLGRVQKAAAAAMLGAIAMVSIQGAALAADQPVKIEPQRPQVVQVEQRTTTAAKASFHAVEKGETLWGISKAHGVPLGAVLKANPQIRDPDLIFPKQNVRIPTQAEVRTFHEAQAAKAAQDTSAAKVSVAVPGEAPRVGRDVVTPEARKTRETPVSGLRDAIATAQAREAAKREAAERHAQRLDAKTPSLERHGPHAPPRIHERTPAKTPGVQVGAMRTAEPDKVPGGDPSRSGANRDAIVGRPEDLGVEVRDTPAPPGGPDDAKAGARTGALHARADGETGVDARDPDAKRAGAKDGPPRTDVGERDVAQAGASGDATRAARDADLPRTWVPSAHASSDAKPDVKPGATSDATAGATKAASDATKAASPANGASAPGAGTPASSAEAPRSVLDRAQSWLVRLLQDEAWKRLSERPMRVDESIDLGTFATGNVKIETVVEDTRWDASRMIHETIAQARGLATKWLRTTGSLELSAPAPAAQPASASGNTIGGKLEAHYEISRPYDYREGQLVPADLFAKLRSAVVTLPLDHHRAEGLEAGSKFSMSGRLQGDAAGKLSAPMTGRATLDARASVDVERQGGTEVVVTIRSSSDLDARATHEVTGRSLTATLGRDRVAMRTFTLDLSKPEAERAYDRLVRFDPEEPIALAKRNAPGVTMTSESVRAEDSAAVEGRADLSATTKVDGRIGVTRVETPDDRRTELTGRAGVVSNPSDATRLEGSLDARFERREAKLGTVEREGRLGAEAKLTTKLGEETPVTVGFTGNGSVDYRFSHPAAEDDLPLPLDGDAARRMPEGASFTLIGNGRLGAKASDARALGGGNTTASVDVSADGRIWLRADKKGGDTIEVDVMVRKNAELDRAARWSRPAADGAAGFGLDYGGTTRTSSDRSGRFQLDLSKEAHRAAYRALLRGDMGPAAAATNVPVPTADTRLDNRDRVRAEVTKLASWADASLELERRSIDAKDPFVTMDADRSAFNDAQKAGGREVRWIDVSGAIAPKVRVEGTTPIGGAVSLRHGFSAEGLVEYRAVRPDLPGVALSPALTAKAAEALPRGSEMALSGTGTLRGSTGLGFGAEYATTGVRASAAAGVDAKVAVSKTYDVRVKRLSDAKVSVTVEERARDERGLDLFARVGATVSTAELVTLPGALGKLDALAKVRTAVDRELSSLLSLDFTHSSTRAKVDTQRAELTIDLSTPAGKKAYEAILGLDADPALAAARRGDAGVKIDSAGIEHTKERGQETKLDAFGSKLYLSKALRSDSTRIDVTSNGETRRDASTYDESYRGLFGRKQNVKWEAVRVRTAEDPVGQGYYRFTFDDADPITSKAEVRSMMRMATGLGAEHAHAPKVEKDRRGLLPLLGSWGQHGKTKAGGEIFLTDKGLQALRALDDEAARLAYAEGLRSTHGGNLPAWADPVKGPKARAILDEFFQYERDRAGAHDGDRRSGLNSEYWWHTGTNLWEDEGDYKSSKAFVEMVRRIRESTDPAMWNKAYADLGEQLRFDFFDSLGAIGRVAGKSETLVHKLEMKGRVIDIQMKDEGLLARP